MQWLTSMELINGIEHASVGHLRTRLDPTFGAAGQSMQSHLHGGQKQRAGHQPTAAWLRSEVELDCLSRVRLVLDMHGVARRPPLTC